MENKKAYRARILNPKSADLIEDFKDGLLVVDIDGRIEYCGHYKDVADCKVTELPSRLIIPGLIDVHSHIPQLDVRGKHGATLLDWLKRYVFPAELAFADPKNAEDVSRRFF